MLQYVLLMYETTRSSNIGSSTGGTRDVLLLFDKRSNRTLKKPRQSLPMRRPFRLFGERSVVLTDDLYDPGVHNCLLY